jgi:hypothetical protein
MAGRSSSSLDSSAVGDRLVIVPAVLLVAGIYAWHWVWLLWAYLLGPRNYVSIFVWLDQPMLPLWGLLFALSLVVGFLATTLIRPDKPIISRAHPWSSSRTRSATRNSVRVHAALHCMDLLVGLWAVPNGTSRLDGRGSSLGAEAAQAAV